MQKSESIAALAAALADAGTIILVTAAGGIFGGVLQETGVGLRIRDLAEVYRIGVLPLAFFVTALVRVAQGSATVAMITAAPIAKAFKPFINNGIPIMNVTKKAR